MEALGIKDLLPPYSDPNLKAEDLLTGVCFAVGGVGYDPWTSKLAVINLLNSIIPFFWKKKKKEDEISSFN